MLVTNWAIKELDDYQEISADIDGFQLWYQLPKSVTASKAGDPFLAAALLPAMKKGEALEIDAGRTVSPRLLENIFLLQEIYHCWNPILKMIPIHAKTSPAEPLNKGVFSFFSGGVDSMFTFLKHREEINYAVFLNGFDFFVDGGIYRTAAARNSSLIERLGKTLIPIETNYFLFGYHHNLSRILTQGSCLGSVALILGFSRALVPATFSYNQLFPWGSHPLTDPLYSNESVEIIHDGAEVRRIDKVMKIASCESALADLTVCLDDMNVNCGKCTKCLRTMISLELMGITASPFPRLPPLRGIRRINWKSDLVFLKENADLAIQRGHKKLRDALAASLRRYERARLFKEIDRVLLGGLVKKLYRRIVKEPALVRRVSVTSDRD